MTRLLLDFRWKLEEALDLGTEISAILLAFDQLCTSERLQPLGFISEKQYQALLNVPASPSRQHALRALGKCVRKARPATRAFPIFGPKDFKNEWTSALGEELHLKDWRTPQIIVCKAKAGDWKASVVGNDHRTEARLTLEGSQQEHHRVFAVLESYGSHLYAHSDHDAWDLQRIRIPDKGAPEHQLHPCSLPMPPELRGLSGRELADAVAGVRDWERGRKCYYLPPISWQPNKTDQDSWRLGNTFQRKSCPHCGRKWPVDRQNRTWCWDETHRHWDVQFSTEYWSVSHDATLLKKKKILQKKKKNRGRRR
jgi:hypothetical protein